MLDITKLVKADKNFINIFQTQKNHRNQFVDHAGHIVGVYLVKVLEPEQLIEFVQQHKVEDPKVSFDRF